MDAVFVTCQVLALSGLVYGFLVCAASYRASRGAEPSYDPFSEYPLGTSNPKSFRPRDLPDLSTPALVEIEALPLSSQEPNTVSVRTSPATL